ncbi:MAG: hypothetical protein RJA22_3363, partial [Verrucomicrobiota bacterium]
MASIVQLLLTLALAAPLLAGKYPASAAKRRRPWAYTHLNLARARSGQTAPAARGCIRWNDGA